MDEDEMDFQLIHAIDPTKIKVPIRERFAKLTLSSNKKKLIKDAVIIEDNLMKRKSASRNLMVEMDLESNKENLEKKMYTNPLLRSDSSSTDDEEKYFDPDKTELSLNAIQELQKNEQSLLMDPLQVTVSEKKSAECVDIENEFSNLSQEFSALTIIKKPLEPISVSNKNENNSIILSSDEESILCITISDSSDNLESDVELDYEQATSLIPKSGETPDALLPNTFSNEKADRIEAFLRDVSFERKEMAKRKHFGSHSTEETSLNDLRPIEENIVIDVEKETATKASQIAVADTESMSVYTDDINAQFEIKNIIEESKIPDNTTPVRQQNALTKAVQIAAADTESMSTYTDELQKHFEINKVKGKTESLDDTMPVSPNHSSIFEMESIHSRQSELYLCKDLCNNSRRLAFDKTVENSSISFNESKESERSNDKLSNVFSSPLNSSSHKSKSCLPLEDSVIISETSEESVQTEKSVPKTNEVILSEVKSPKPQISTCTQHSDVHLDMNSFSISAKFNIKIRFDAPVHNVSSATESEDSNIDANENRKSTSSLPSNVSNTTNNTDDANEILNKTGDGEVQDVQEHVHADHFSTPKPERQQPPTGEDADFMSHAAKLLNELYGKAWQTPEVLRSLKGKTKAPTMQENETPVTSKQIKKVYGSNYQTPKNSTRVQKNANAKFTNTSTPKTPIYNDNYMEPILGNGIGTTGRTGKKNSTIKSKIVTPKTPKENPQLDVLELSGIDVETGKCTKKREGTGSAKKTVCSATKSNKVATPKTPALNDPHKENFGLNAIEKSAEKREDAGNTMRSGSKTTQFSTPETLTTDENFKAPLLCHTIEKSTKKTPNDVDFKFPKLKNTDNTLIADFSTFRHSIAEKDLDSTRFSPNKCEKVLNKKSPTPKKLESAIKKITAQEVGRSAKKQLARERWRKIALDDSSEGENASDDEDVDVTEKNLLTEDSDDSDDSFSPKKIVHKTKKVRSNIKDDSKIIYLDLTQDKIKRIKDNLKQSPPANKDEQFSLRLQEILKTCKPHEKPKLEATEKGGKIKRKLFNLNFGFEEGVLNSPVLESRIKPLIDKLEVTDINSTGESSKLFNVFNKQIEALKTAEPIFKVTPPRTKEIKIKNDVPDTPQRKLVDVTPKLKTTVAPQTPISTSKKAILTGDIQTPRSKKKDNMNKFPTVNSLIETPICKYGFLKSLDMRVSKSLRHPDAIIYQDNYRTKKEELAQLLYNLYNDKLFDNLLDVPLVWNKKLLNTAGRCLNKSRLGVRTCVIELSEKVLTSSDRLRCTLVHELCHAATWIFDNDNGHGAKWKAWARKANTVFPELPKIGVCHQYDIEYKYTYQCTLCAAKSYAHSKSKKVDNIRCSYCHGAIEIFLNKKDKEGNIIPTPVREPTGFAKFVQDNYKQHKQPTLKHADVMKILSEQYAKMKANGKK